MGRKPAQYAIYQGEEFLDIGTVDQLAEKFEVRSETIRFWATPTHQKRMANEDGSIGDRKVVIKLEEDEE